MTDPTTEDLRIRADVLDSMSDHQTEQRMLRWAADRIEALEDLFIEAACDAGWNDKTQREAIGVKAFYAQQERDLDA